MKKIELNVRLSDAAELIDDVSANLVDLLDEAVSELEIALDILEDFNDPRAKKFIIRHSTLKEGAPLPPSIAGFKRPVKKVAYITGETVTRKND